MIDDAAHARVRHALASSGERGISGVLYVARGGEPVLVECLGLADRAADTPVAPHTRFATASVTKSFTAAAVLDQVAQGRFGLETPVVDVVPEDRRPRRLRDDVTVHHLLTHTSAIADYFEEDEDLPGYAGDDYGVLWRTVPPGIVERPVDFLPLYRDLAPYAPPGEPWRYSNAGYVLLGEVLEQVTGQPCTEVIAERVLDRAGMADSGFDRSDDPRPDTALHYLPSGRTNVHSVPVVGGGDGGCVCSAADLVRFCRALASGELLGDLTATALRAHSDLGDGFGYGYGVLTYPDGRFGHDGGDPGVSALYQHWPDHDVTIVALCNVQEDDDVDPAFELRDVFLAEWPR